MQTTHDLISWITDRILSHYDTHEIAQNNAWNLLEYCTRKTQAQLLLQETLQLTFEEYACLEQVVHDITVLHKPIQYILGTVPFLDLELIVRPPILIPRPETEEWCQNLIDTLKKNNARQLSILDMCSGNGCIALALAQALPDSTVLGCDINPAAVELAQENQKHNNITNCHFIVSNLFEKINHNAQFDLIVSNPPYLTKEEWSTVAPEVGLWEDPQALIADDNGMALIDIILEQSKNHLTHKLTVPQLWVEIGSTQGQFASDHAYRAGYAKVEILQDIYGKDRVLCAQLKE